MAITVRTSLNVEKQKTTTTDLNSYYPYIQTKSSLNQNIYILHISVILKQIEELLTKYITLSQTDDIIYTYSSLNSILGEIESNISILSNENFFKSYIGLSTYSDLIKTAQIQVSDKYYSKILNARLQALSSKFNIFSPMFNSTNIAESGSVSLYAIDTFGPRLSGLVPASGSTYNSQTTSVSFTLIDNEHTRINPSGIYFYVNNINVVSGGVGISNLSGTTGFVALNDYTYSFNYIPNYLFSPDSQILVSGKADDTNVPTNSGIFNYSFRVQKTQDLYGNITGIADTQSPYLTNLNPSNLSTNIPINTNIILDIVDDHTGVNQNSVIIEVGDTIITSGGYFFNQTTYPTSIVSINSGKGFRYMINPLYDFPFNTIINTYIYAEDLYTPAINSLDTSYSFITYNNSYLSKSELEIFTEGNWVVTNPLISYQIAQSGIDFRVKFLNSSGTGIDLINSSIIYNDTIVSGLNYTELISGYEYLVDFNIIPNYKKTCDLVFHIVESGTISGITIYNNYHNNLLFGAEVCYTPEHKLEYSKEVPILVSVEDAADWPTLDSNFYKLTTTLQPSNDLYGAIIALPLIYKEMIGEYIANNPFFEYGKTMELELSAKDYSGNELVYKWSFKIEDKVS